MKVRKQSQFPLDLLLKLIDRPLILGCEIISHHSRGYAFTGTLTDQDNTLFRWKWKLPLRARKAFLEGYVPSYIVSMWFGFARVNSVDPYNPVYLPGNMRPPFSFESGDPT